MSVEIEDFGIKIPSDKVKEAQAFVEDHDLSGTLRIVDKDGKCIAFPREVIVSPSTSTRVAEFITFVRDMIKGTDKDNQVISGSDTGGCRILSMGRDLLVKISKAIPQNGKMQIALEVEQLAPGPHKISNYYGIVSKKTTES